MKDFRLDMSRIVFVERISVVNAVNELNITQPASGRITGASETNMTDNEKELIGLILRWRSTCVIPDLYKDLINDTEAVVSRYTQTIL